MFVLHFFVTSAIFIFKLCVPDKIHDENKKFYLLSGASYNDKSLGY